MAELLVVLHDLWFAFRLALALVLGIGWALSVGVVGGLGARAFERRGGGDG